MTTVAIVNIIMCTKYAHFKFSHHARSLTHCVSFTCSFVRLEKKNDFEYLICWKSQSFHRYYCLIKCALSTKEIIQIKMNEKERNRYTLLHMPNEKERTIFMFISIKYDKVAKNLLLLTINDNDIMYVFVLYLCLLIFGLYILHSLLNIKVASILRHSLMNG